MTWEEIKALPDREFLKAMDGVVFNYGDSVLLKYRARYKFSDFSEGAAGDIYCYLFKFEFSTLEWKRQSFICLREYNPPIPSLQNGIYIDTSVAWVHVFDQIVRDMIIICPGQEGEES